MRTKAGCGSGPSRGGNCQSQSCGDSTACELTALLEHLAEIHGDNVVVRIADYSSLSSIQQSLTELNRILEANHVSLSTYINRF